MVPPAVGITRLDDCMTRVADSYELQPPGASVAIGAIRAVLEQGGSSLRERSHKIG